MRDVSFLHDTHDNGFHVFRAVFPLGDYWFDGPPAADGQFGNIAVHGAGRVEVDFCVVQARVAKLHVGDGQSRVIDERTGVV